MYWIYEIIFLFYLIRWIERNILIFDSFSQNILCTFLALLSSVDKDKESGKRSSSSKLNLFWVEFLILSWWKSTSLFMGFFFIAYCFLYPFSNTLRKWVCIALKAIILASYFYDLMDQCIGERQIIKFVVCGLVAKNSNTHVTYSIPFSQFHVHINTS